MTKGDRDRIRAEIAGRLVAALIVAESSYHPAWEAHDERCERHLAEGIKRADALMDRLGLSEASELARIQEEAMRRRGLGNPSLTNPFHSGYVP